MKIIPQSQSIKIVKPEGVEVNYYLFDEYEVMTNIQEPNTSQVWHHHDHIWETMYMIDGQMTAEWIDGGEKRTQVLSAGDLIVSERSPHTFVNNFSAPARFLTIKQVLHGENHRELFKTDKIPDNPA